MTNPKAYRLPTFALPRRYDIDIDARLDSDDVHGTVDILLDISESNNFLELHALHMTVPEAVLKANGKNINGNVTLDEDREIARIDFPEPIPTGQATLHLAFDHPVSNGLEGLYRRRTAPNSASAPSARRPPPAKSSPAWTSRLQGPRSPWKVTTDARTHRPCQRPPRLHRRQPRRQIEDLDFPAHQAHVKLPCRPRDWRDRRAPLPKWSTACPSASGR